MNDVADQGSEIEEFNRDNAIKNRVVYEGVSSTECESCGVEIPAARQKAVPGVKSCIDCATLEEIRDAHVRGRR